ncbi:hypothetical protein CR194_11420 [Salipaludibacillus keqinensis]|uniref:Radical SAM protein n=1 Tax=Salipaludibacillus keqinensis TaxID=2045207 RepID=A0A323THW4_9BACI|nr:hypothetical protein [Salipaludibacillus keqinensis]PYZ93756.1 hypothetical protein CR194_11420 [Salipaludibacillus keqinensis]
MAVAFIYDSRLGIPVPELKKPWEDLDPQNQSEILAKWEEVRGDIPDRIKIIEESINELQAQLYRESDFNRSCQINSDIAELASIINDLWIWYRTGDDVHVTARY